MFTRIWGSTVSLQAFTGHVPARMLRAWAEAAGLDGTRITAQTRHKDLSVLVSRYIRPLEALATTSSKDLGL
jgi:hypothetical protein